jgi:hypothetical protein
MNKKYLPHKTFKAKMSKTTNNNDTTNNNGDLSSEACLKDDIFDGPFPQMKREMTIESDVFMDDLGSSLEIPTMRYQESNTMPFRYQNVTPYNSGPYPHDAEMKTYVYPGPSYRGYTKPQAMTRCVALSDETQPAKEPFTRCITLSEIAEESQPATVPLRRLVSSTVTPNIIESVYETVYVENPFKRTHTYDSPAWFASNPPVEPVSAPFGMTRGVTYWNPLGIHPEDELKYREEMKQDGYNTPP